MDRRRVLSREAAAHFIEGYNCAQSVLLTMFRHWNGTSELVPKIATCFGSGIGRCGSVCGVVTGGVMALGIKFGTNEPSSEKRTKSYEIAQRFYRQFEEENRSTLCRELIGYDLSDPAELEKARKSKVFERKCHVFIKKAIGALIDLTENPC